MAKFTLPNDVLPARAGFVRLTPYDAAGKLLRDKAVTTRSDFVQSVQHTTSRTVSTVPNGNGQDLEVPNDETHNLVLTTAVYDHVFHSLYAGLRQVSELKPVIMSTTIVPTQGSEIAEYTFTEGNYPAAESDGTFAFEIRDAFGNLLKQGSGSPTTDDYVYESSGHKLSFPVAYVDQELSCVYYIEATGGVGYEADPILKTQKYMIEVGAEVKSASTLGLQRYYARITKGTVNGDVTGVTTQKDMNTTLTYSFKSAPVGAGVSPYYESLVPIADPGAAAASVMQEKTKKL